MIKGMKLDEIFCSAETKKEVLMRELFPPAADHFVRHTKALSHESATFCGLVEKFCDGQ